MAARVRVWGPLAPSLLLSLSWLALAAVAPRNARAGRAESEEVRAAQYVERYGKVRAHAAPHCACASPDAALWPTPVSASLAGRRAYNAHIFEMDFAQAGPPTSPSPSLGSRRE